MKSTGKPTVGKVKSTVRVGVRKTQDKLVSPQEKLANAMRKIAK